MKIRTIIYLLVFIIVLFLYNSFFGFKPENDRTIVTNVIDGDTIVISGGERVRLLGIDTPEKGEFFYKESKARLEELIENKNVTLEKEGDNKDKYDRLLRYIFLNDTNINLQMVEEGLAICYFYEKSKYQEACKNLEENAMQNKIGRWQEKS
ncbi:thermonuclease family protein [Candidatus Pacearchaeota archaeon]|nr:thermonuclease family protein [Candidatus Pacearchaeota archaeon]